MWLRRSVFLIPSVLPNVATRVYTARMVPWSRKCRGDQRVPAKPGRYRVEPPPDLNEAGEKNFLLEYDAPYLYVNEIALPGGYNSEYIEVVRQTGEWTNTHPELLSGSLFGHLHGFQVFKPLSTPQQRLDHQLVPTTAYIDRATRARLTDKEFTETMYTPCVPVWVIYLVQTKDDNVSLLQQRVATFVDCGTQEGVVIDTRRNRVWIHNRDEAPYFDDLSCIEFNSWPGFILDSVEIRDARLRDGFL